MQRNLYWMAYSAPESVITRGGKSQDFTSVLHMTRDGVAFAEVQAALGRDHDYGGPLLNLPAKSFADKRTKIVPRHRPNRTFADEDLIVLVTRPPLMDREGQRRIILRSGTELEGRVFDGLKRFFACVTRECVIVRKGLLPESAWRAVRFRSTKAGPAREATVQGHGILSTEEELQNKMTCTPVMSDETLGYVVFVPDLGERGGAAGPDLLAAFAMGGTENLAWASLLRARHSGLLQKLVRERKPRLLAGQFVRDVDDSELPVDLSFVDDWPDVEWILDETLDAA